MELNIKKKFIAIMCFGFVNEIPKTVEELDLFTRDAYLQSSREIKKLVNSYRLKHTV